MDTWYAKSKKENPKGLGRQESSFEFGYRTSANLHAGLPKQGARHEGRHWKNRQENEQELSKLSLLIARSYRRIIRAALNSASPLDGPGKGKFPGRGGKIWAAAQGKLSKVEYFYARG